MFNLIITSGVTLITTIMLITITKEQKIKKLSKQLIDNDDVLHKLLTILLADKEFDNYLLINKHRKKDPCIEWNGLNLYLSPLLGVKITGVKENNFINVTVRDYLKTVEGVKELSFQQLNTLIYNILYYSSKIKNQSLNLNSNLQPLLQIGYQKYLNSCLYETFKLIERGNETYDNRQIINYASNYWIISFSFEVNNSNAEKSHIIRILSFLRRDMTINFFNSTVQLDEFNNHESIDHLKYALFRTLQTILT